MLRSLFLCPLLLTSAAPAFAQAPVTLTPIGDAHVRGGSYAQTNYGAADVLQVKHSANERYVREALLRFDFGGTDRQAVSRATLRLYCADRPNAEPAPIAVYQAARWSESTTTYATKPALLSGPDDEVAVTTCARWYGWDVTGLVRSESGSTFSFALSQTPGTNRLVSFSSREGSRPPELVLEFDPPAATDFAALARAYADAMIADGRDTYGPVSSPLFSTMLDREAMALIPDPETTIPVDRNVHGIRSGDRAWNAANLDDDHALHELLYALADRTGDASYAAEADASLAWYATHADEFGTGLLAWGEHAAWRLDTDAATRHPSSTWSNLKHELQLDMTGLWPELFALAPAAMTAYARALWEQHVYDKQDVIWAHQARLDGAYADEGFVFARMAGHMVSVWAHAYAASSSAAVRAEMRGYIDAVADAHNGRRNPTSDAVTQWWGTPQSPGEVGREIGHSTSNDLQGVVDAQRALDLGVLPAATEARLRDWVARSTETFHAVDHPFGRGGVGFYNRVDRETLAPAGAAGTEPWCYAYGKVGPAVSAAADVLTRYEQSGDARFLQLARAAADWYRGRTPSCTVTLDGAPGPLPLWPEPVASAIELFLGVHRATGDAAYLAEAERLGHFAAGEFLDGVSALPRVFAKTGNASGYSHYEGHTGGPDLMLALYRLGLALEAGPSRAAAAQDAQHGAAPADLQLHVHPNPAADCIAVGYALAGNGPLAIRVFDALGREVVLREHAEARAGEHVETVDVSALPAGAYVVRVRAGGRVATRVFTVVR